MSKILPYIEKPLLLAYQNKAFPVGVIQANSTVDITKWLCTKCINCFFDSASLDYKFDLCMNDVWGLDEGIVMHQIIHLKKDLFDLLNLDLISNFHTIIDHNCYIHGEYNEKYIPCKAAYNKCDYTHDFLLVGYDQDKFISVGYVADGTYKFFEISNNDLLKSTYGVDKARFNFTLFSYIGGAIPKPNIKRAVNDLDAYISTSESIHSPLQQRITYGIDSVYRLKEFFEYDVKNNKPIYFDNRYSRVLMENKWAIMQLAKNFLNDGDKQTYSKLASDNYDRANRIHMLGLKMMLSADEKNVDRISSLMDGIIDSELEYIPHLIKTLKNKYAEEIL